MIKSSLERGVDPNTPLSLYIGDPSDTLINKACLNGDYDTIDLALSYGGSVTKKGKCGSTPLDLLY